MKRKVMGILLSSIALLTLVIGVIQIQNCAATSNYDIRIRVTKMQLYDDGDGWINGWDKGEVYMLDPGSDWPASQKKKYKGGFWKTDYQCGTLTYDITEHTVYYATISSSPIHEYTYYLMDQDAGADDILWFGKVRVEGPTNGWVKAWSLLDGTKTLASGNAEITTFDTLWGTHILTFGGFGTIVEIPYTFYNALYFEIYVATTNII